MPLQKLKNKTYSAVMPLLCAVALIYISIGIFSIRRNMAGYLNEARIKSGAQAQLLAENIAGTINGVDMMLRSIHSIFITHQSGTDLTVPVQTTRYIELELRFRPQIKDIVLLSSGGDVEYSSAGSKDFEMTSFDEYRDAWLDFSVDAVIAEKGGGRLIFSRRLEDQGAGFLGVLAAVVDLSFFDSRFNDYLNIDIAAIALMDIDGKVLASWFEKFDAERKLTGANIRTIPYFSSFSKAMLSSGGRKTYESNDAIVSVHQLAGFPFQVAVSYNRKSVLKKWRRESARDIAIILFTILIVIFAMTLAHRHRRRRLRAELNLLAHQAGLEKTVAERTSELSKTNRELAEKNSTLENALLEVKILSGLLPICANCKKIRDDRGYWNQIENYIQRHSGAKFTHGICPECEKKLYPELKENEKLGKREHGNGSKAG